MNLSCYKGIHKFVYQTLGDLHLPMEGGGRGGGGDLRKSNFANRPKNSFIELNEKIER